LETSNVDRESLKELAVRGALDWIGKNYDLSTDMRVGIGSGSTVVYSFREFAKYPKITAIPTSENTSKKLIERGVEVDELKDADDLEFDIDGADEVDPELNLIKGGGGCHYREKIVAKKSKLLIIVVDQTKLVDYLGQTHPLPVEVDPETRNEARNLLSKYGKTSFRKSDGGLFRTDNSNVIIDVNLNETVDRKNLEKLEREINLVDGVVENGFFVSRKADLVFVGTEDGLRVIGDESDE